MDKRLGKAIVKKYEAKEFPAIVSDSAKDFSSVQGHLKSEFTISPLVAELAGIAELNRRTVDEKIELVVLERLKIIEEQAYKEAYDLGRLEGTEKAVSDCKNQIAASISRLDEILLMIDGCFEQMVAEHEILLVRLVSKIASRIAMTEIESNRELVIEVIKRILYEAQTNEDVVIRLSPEDEKLLAGLREKSDRRVEQIRRIKIEVSEDLSPGGAIVETKFGAIDASLEERVKKTLEAIEQKLPRVRHGQSGENK